MELMSSLLLCALVAMVRQALGQSLGEVNAKRKLNSTIYLREKPTTNKKVLLNINGPPLVNMVNEIQTVFSDVACRPCIDCMERAIKANKAGMYFSKNRPTNEELQNSVLHNHYNIDNYRVKRQTDNETKPLAVKNAITNLKSEIKIQDSTTITKYNLAGKIYALKIKDKNNQNLLTQRHTKKESLDCHIYSVKKTYTCDSPEADVFISNYKKKTKKEQRAEKVIEKKINYRVATTLKSTLMYKKRQVDNSQTPENDMTSIEELIY